MSSGPFMLTCHRCGQSFSSQYQHRCAMRDRAPTFSPREAMLEVMANGENAPAMACVNCAFYRPVDTGIRQEGKCFLQPPILVAGAEPPWERPAVRWSDFCSHFKYNIELGAHDAEEADAVVEGDATHSRIG